MTNNLLTFALCGLLCLFSSCGGDYIFQQTIKMEDAGWGYGDPLHFDFEITDLSKQYDLILEVVHSGDYGFQNLYVKFNTVYPSGEQKEQVVSLELAGKSGIWNGDCSGNTCAVSIPLQVKALFQDAGKHRITVEQFMRKNPLRGIEEMALLIAPHIPN